MAPIGISHRPQLPLGAVPKPKSIQVFPGTAKAHAGEAPLGRKQLGHLQYCGEVPGVLESRGKIPAAHPENSD